MKIKFKKLDKTCFVIMLWCWGALYYYLSEGKFVIRSIVFIKAEDPFSFWFSITLLVFLGILFTILSIVDLDSW